MTAIEITTELTPWHIHHVADHMRAADAAELWALSRISPLMGLYRSVEASSMAWAATIDGEPVAVWGVGPVTFTSDCGLVWMLGTPKLERHQISVLRRCRPHVHEMQAPFERIGNVVDVRNTKSIRWLGWLGFTFLPIIRTGFDLLPFLPFERHRRGDECVTSGS